jgi:hypothetical protein
MIVEEEDLKHNDFDNATIIEDGVHGEFSKEDIMKDIIILELTHPAGFGNLLDVEEETERTVREWFEDNVTDYDVEARDKVIQKFYDRILDDVEEKYKECKSEVEEGDSRDKIKSVVNDKI